MPRRKLLRVQPFPKLRSDQWCRLRVTGIDWEGTGLLVVRLTHCDAAQAGRTHACRFPLPIRPEGALAELLRALGIDLTVGRCIDPKEAVGQYLEARFVASGGNDDCQPVAFRPVRDGSSETASESER